MMKQMNFRLVCFIAFTALLLVIAGGAVAQQQVDAKAQLCLDFGQNIVFGDKLDEASKYVTDDYKEHHAGLNSNSLAEYQAKVRAQRAARGGRGATRPGGAPPNRTIMTGGDLVVFITLNPAHPDPNDASKTIPQFSHFD